MSTARAHHYVPQTYLRAWAENGQVAVRRRGAADAFVTSTRRVLQERDLYRVDEPGLRQDVVETMLSDVEGDIPTMLRNLRMGNIPRKGTDLREKFAELIALQSVRTPDRLVMSRLPEQALERAGDFSAIDDTLVIELFVEHVGREPSQPEVEGLKAYLQFSGRPENHIDRTGIVRSMFAPAERAVPVFRDGTWTVEQTKGPTFLTSDTPVHVWCRRPPRWQGVGLLGADEIRYPIGPRHLLVIRPQGTEGVQLVKRSRVSDVNRHLIATAWRTVVGLPTQVSELSLASVRPIRPLLIVSQHDAIEQRLDGHDKEVEMLHFFRPYDDGSSDTGSCE